MAALTLAQANRIIAAILEREPDWSATPAQTPVSIRRLLQRCLEKDPRRRLRDIGDARLEIEEALGASVSSGGAVAPAGASPDRLTAAARPARLARWAAAAAGLPTKPKPSSESTPK